MTTDVIDLDLTIDTGNPLDAVETVLSDCKLSYTRADDDELILTLDGQQGNYDILLFWQRDCDALQLVCRIPVDIPANREDSLVQLLAAINARLWLGHFERDGGDGPVQFRYTTLLRAPTPLSGIDHMHDLLRLAVTECDWFLPGLRLLADGQDLSADDLTFLAQDPIGRG